MQAYAEGFDIFKNATSKELPEDIRYDLNLPDIAEVWRRGSVVSSWLLDLTAMALAENPTLSEYSGFVQDSGEGRWTIQAALEEAVPAEVLTAALYTRFRSRQDHTFAEKMLSAMRQKFGGHVEPKRQRNIKQLRAMSFELRQSECILSSQLIGSMVRSALYRGNDGSNRSSAGNNQTAGRTRTGDPCVMVIFGFSGDLTRRKLIPALYNLASQQLLSREFAVIGVGRNPMSDDDARKKVTEDFKQFATGTDRCRSVGMVRPPHKLRQWEFRRSRYLRQAERNACQGRSGA